jgi:uncharacterized protein (TIGR00255 family)
MTAYGEGREKIKEIDLLLQIKSVNHRFLELEIRSLGEIPLRMEAKIRDRVKAKVARGKVTINIRIKRTKLPNYSIVANQVLASHYHKVLSQLSNSLDLRERISLSHLLNLPELIYLERTEEDGDKIEKPLFKALSKALAEFLQMRKREGRNHLHSIRASVEGIENSFPLIEKELSLNQEDYQRKIKRSLEELLEKEIREKIVSEIPLLLSRGDISEEKVRFQSHLEELKRTLEMPGPIGKRLSFILQELHREINTIGAKTDSFAISRLVVKIKDYLERIR